MNFLCQVFRKLLSDRQTDTAKFDRQTQPKLYTTPLREWSINATKLHLLIYYSAIIIHLQCESIKRTNLIPLMQWLSLDLKIQILVLTNVLVLRFGETQV